MQIDCLQLKNFRRHEDLRLDLRPITVLLGPNNIGKSAVIDSLSLLSTLSRYQPYKFSDRGNFTFEALARNGASTPISIEARFVETSGDTPTRAEYQVSLGQTAAGNAKLLDIVSERLVVDGSSRLERTGASSSGQLATVFAGFLPNASIFGGMQAAFRQGVRLDDPGIRRVHGLLRAVGEYRMVPHAAAQPGAATPSEGAFPNVAKNGRGLADLLGYLAAYEPDALESIARDVAISIDGFDGFEFGPAETPQEEQFLARFSDSRGSIGAAQLSDGTLNLIGLATVLRSPRQFQLLCLEEPEIGLTPRAINTVADILGTGALTHDGAQPQVVVSTHSPFLVSALLNKSIHDATLRESLSILVIDRDLTTGRTQARPFEEVTSELFDSTTSVGPERIAYLMSQLFG